MYTCTFAALSINHDLEYKLFIIKTFSCYDLKVADIVIVDSGDSLTKKLDLEP